MWGGRWAVDLLHIASNSSRTRSIRLDNAATVRKPSRFERRQKDRDGSSAKRAHVRRRSPQEPAHLMNQLSARIDRQRFQPRDPACRWSVQPVVVDACGTGVVPAEARAPCLMGERMTMTETDAMLVVEWLAELRTSTVSLAVALGTSHILAAGVQGSTATLEADRFAKLRATT